jgi:hypothetical protein
MRWKVRPGERTAGVADAAPKRVMAASATSLIA